MYLAKVWSILYNRNIEKLALRIGELCKQCNRICDYLSNAVPKKLFKSKQYLYFNYEKFTYFNDRTIL